MTGGKYAQVEIERRFLLDAVPPAAGAAPFQIEDRYLDDARLRLRRITDAAGVAQHKLTQKSPAPGAGAEERAITTIYVSESEHAALAVLPAATLRKTRLHIEPYLVDVFAAPLTGLVLAEVAFSSLADARAFTPAPFCRADVTADERFTGASLARATGAEVTAWARSVLPTR